MACFMHDGTVPAAMDRLMSLTMVGMSWSAHSFSRDVGMG